MKVIVALFLIFLTNIAISKETLLDLPDLSANIEAEVDQLFENGQYEEAFEIHLMLAKFGYKYSQYMVSVQYLHGLGVEQNLPKAYGWANLARRIDSAAMQEHFDNVRLSISENELSLAEKVRDELSKEYSDLVIAARIKNIVNNTIPECTGSRIRGNCNFVQYICLIENKEVYEKCQQDVALRQPEVIKNLRKAYKNIDNYIELKLESEGTISIKESSDQNQAQSEDKNK